MKVSQGDVIVGPDFIGGNNKRPFVVISDEDHPFNSEYFLENYHLRSNLESSLNKIKEKFGRRKYVEF